MDLNKNHGVITEPLTETDFRVGGVTGITYDVVNLSGNWTSYLPTNERQASDKADYMNCVTQSGHNSLETQLNHLISEHRVPQGLLNWLIDQGYIDEENHANFNDCFTAKLAGTTKQGLSMQKFWDCVRHNGLIPEKDWHRTSDNLSWDDYYSEIPQNPKNKGLEFLKWFEIQYEWVRSGSEVESDFTTISKHIKQAPMQIATPTCSPWGGDIIPACGQAVSHATMSHRVAHEVTHIFDTYEPFQKRLAADYPIPFMLKGIIKIKTFEITCEQARFVYLTRPDVAAAFPASNRFVSPVDPNLTIYDWCRDNGIYEMQNVFLNNIMDYNGDMTREEEAKQLEPEIKKNENFIVVVIKWFLNLFKTK